MADINLSELLDGRSMPQPRAWRPKEWLPVARDRVGDRGAVMCLQRVTAQSFFSMTTVYAERAGSWVEVFENGDQWPVPPTSPRPPSGSAFAMLTGTSGSAGIAFTAGVVTTAVARLRVASAVEQHDVEVDEQTGAFVALSLQGDDGPAFQLVAFDRDGNEIGRIEHESPW